MSHVYVGSTPTRPVSKDIMKIRVITCCKNEEEMLPFFLQWYSRIADDIVIYDGNSTDNSLKVISQWPKARVIVNDNPEMDERNLTGIRNKAYKINRMNYDWQIIVDVDEFVYHSDLLNQLMMFTSTSITLPKIVGYDMYSMDFPIYNEHKTIIDQIQTGRRNDQWQKKNVIFNPQVIDINYEFGCHKCHPSGMINESTNELLLLHYNYIGYDHFIKRHKFNAARMSKFNKERNLAYHITEFSTMTREQFEQKIKNEAEQIQQIQLGPIGIVKRKSNALPMNILYFIDHIYEDGQLDQSCHIHNKDWLSQYFNILFIVRTDRETHVKFRSKFKVKLFNKDVKYEEIKKEIEAFKPDIIQLFGPLSFGNAINVVNDFNCDIIQHYAGNDPALYWHPKMKYLIIENKAQLPAFSHVPQDKILIKNNCCDLDIYRPKPEMFKKYDAICVGGFYGGKCQEILVDIFKDEPFRFLFVGKQGTPEFEIAKSIVRTKLQVDFVSFIDSKLMPDVYNSAKMFIWGSNRSIENPITLTNRSCTEAVACGLPIVAFKDTFQQSHFVINGQNAYLVNDASEFKKSMYILSTDEKQRQLFSDNSRKVAEQQLNFKIWHDKFYFDLYHNLKTKTFL